MFLSTPPSRVATGHKVVIFLLILVSIHATLAGGDDGLLGVVPEGLVSIHATLAGGDSMTKE